MLLFGTLLVAAAGLIVLLFRTWTFGQWWWTFLCCAVLSGWAYLATHTRPGDKRNDFGV